MCNRCTVVSPYLGGGGGGERTFRLVLKGSHFMIEMLATRSPKCTTFILLILLLINTTTPGEELVITLGHVNIDNN